MTTPAAPRTLGPGGKKLWSSLVREDMPEYELTLLAEACRVRDRLDKLDKLLRGDLDAWVCIVEGRTRVTLSIDDALGKSVSLAASLRGLLNDLPEPVTDAGKPGKTVTEKATGLDQLAQRRAARAAGRERPSRR
jgi:hypothetical protein